MRKFIITEDQYKKILESANSVQVSTTPQNLYNAGVQKGTNKNAAKEKVKNYAQQQGLNNVEVVDTTDGDNNTTTTNTTATTTESTIKRDRIITKKQIYEGMLAALKKDTRVYTVKDFLSR